MSYSDDRFGRKGGKYRETQIKLTSMFNAHSDILNVAEYTQDDLIKTPFYEEYELLLGVSITHASGNMQKPYFIQKHLRTLPDNSYLLYHDARHDLWPNDFDYLQCSLKPHLEMCNRNMGVLIGTAGQTETGCLHRYYSSPICMRVMKVEKFKDQVQECASWVLLKNTPFTHRFVGEWLYYNTQEDCASYFKNRTTDQARDKGFREHRGDQSILTLLLRKYNLTNLMETPCKNVFSIYASEACESRKSPTSLCD